jgi:hypothetical protein
MGQKEMSAYEQRLSLVIETIGLKGTSKNSRLSQFVRV